ncbi:MULTISPECIES: hypothetical protein [unclassified Shinella]|uniref:hypothetical protein n=1 Tax=unclassified Shinella TaxID=2643062 RepID=UPI00234ED059|nr:hypothetical protein [Shinella sp. YE25]MDC7259137.1 hypothetical protein [Shinella sp. YE25]
MEGKTTGGAEQKPIIDENQLSRTRCHFHVSPGFPSFPPLFRACATVLERIEIDAGFGATAMGRATSAEAHTMKISPIFAQQENGLLHNPPNTLPPLTFPEIIALSRKQITSLQR